LKFPKEKISFTSTYEGKSSEAGWLVLDITAMDLEGVGKIYIDLADVAAVKERRQKETDALEQAKKLLGGMS